MSGVRKGYFINAPGLYKLQFREFAERMRVDKLGFLANGNLNLETLEDSLLNLTIVYCNRIQDLFYVPEQAIKKQMRIFIADSPLTAAEHGLSSIGVGSRENEDFYSYRSSLDAFDLPYSTFTNWVLNPEEMIVHQEPVTDITSNFLAANITYAALSPIHTFMYRLDKDTDRPKAQSLSYAYIWGEYKRIPFALKEWPHLVKLLEAEPTDRLRLACAKVREGMDIDEAAGKFDVARFDISYLKSRAEGS